MKTLHFKTNINCSGCIAKVGPILDKEKDILQWQVNTESPEKTLTVETEQLSPEAVESLVKAAGFKIELV